MGVAPEKLQTSSLQTPASQMTPPHVQSPPPHGQMPQELDQGGFVEAGGTGINELPSSPRK